MSESDLVTVGVFANRIEAELAQSALTAAEIDSLLSGDDAGGMRPHLAVNGIALMVRAADAEDAAAVIRGFGDQR